MTSQYEPVRRLPNMQDVGPGDLAARDAAISTLRELFSLRGYDRTETPILEQTELYLRKSGGALSSRLYGFSEPGGHEVSLRPEFTAAILRRAADVTSESGGPVRLMYDGPVFRYASPEDEDGDKTRQFTQLGGELIGPPAPSADGEIIAMAIEGLESLGVFGPRVVVGHVGVVLAALNEFNLSERAKLFLVNSIAELKNGQFDTVSDRAAALGFISDLVVDDVQVAADRERLASTIEQVMTEGIGVTLGQSTGSRTTEEIVARLARKMSQADNPDDFKRALEMISGLAQVNGPVGEALEAGRGILSKAGVSADLISNLGDVLAAAEVEGVSGDQIGVDFGLARGIAYYTGMLFDIYAGDADATETLGGGGRYDGLTRALGYGCDVPALGFAYNLDSVVAAVAGSASSSSSDDVTLVSPSGSDSVDSAVTKARELRSSGKRAAVDFENSGSLKPGSTSDGQGTR